MMSKKIAVVWLSLVMVFSFIVILLEIAQIVEGPPITIYVDDDYTPATSGWGVDHFDSIQEGIDNASEGDTVFVYNGTYDENVIVNKTLNLTGENKDSTIINGSGSGDVVYMSADWVNITGFTINGSGPVWGDAGIELYVVHNCSIFNNNVSNNEIGLYLNGASNNTISNSNISSNTGCGIYLVSSSNNAIKGINVTSNIGNGICLEGTTNNTILCNNVSSNIGEGMILITSSDSNIIKNDVTDNMYGIKLRDSKNSFITGNNILLNTAFGIDISSSSSYNTITDNNLSNNDGGIYLGFSSNNNLTGNKFVNNGIFIRGFQVEHWNTHDIDISNTVNDKPVYYLKNQTGGTIPPGVGQVILANCTDFRIESQEFSHCTVGIELGFSTHIEINGNNISNTKHGMWLTYSDYNNITNNNVSGNDWKGIHIIRSNWNNITGNNVSLSKEDGITLTESDNNTLSYNEVFLNERYAVYLMNSPKNIIKCNNVSGNYGQGIHLYLSQHNRITSNDVFSNFHNGIYLYESSNNNITNNNASWNIENGIYLYSSSDRNRIEGNNVQSNNWGIYLAYSSNNTITVNNFSCNWYGARISNSFNNKIYHNNFFDNTFQAYDSNIKNIWNYSYPSGGNYWSDYGGVDNNKGPNQDISGSDGIGDTPYDNIISTNNKDYYPLMTPYGNLTFLYEGWNLVSIPFIQLDTNLSYVLAQINDSYNTIWWYNTSDKKDYWKVNNTQKPPLLNDLVSIDHKMGFWIHITKPGGVIFNYPGKQPTENQTIPLFPGWNLVGYPSKSCYNRTFALNNIDFGDEVDAIWTYNSATQKWEEINESDHFELGKGYWIHSKVKKVWDVPL